MLAFASIFKRENPTQRGVIRPSPFPARVTFPAARAFLWRLWLTGIVLALHSGRAQAAIIDRVNPTNDRIIVRLTQAEMSGLDEGQEVVVEVLQPHIVINAVLGKLNPVRQTVVVIFSFPDERLAKNQQVRFLSVFWNHELEPVLNSYTQYYQFHNADAEGGAGIFMENLASTSNAGNHKIATSGWRLAGNAYAPLNMTWFGAGFGYEHREAHVNPDVGAQPPSTLAINRLRPGFWTGVVEKWRLSMRYDYTTIETTEKSTPAVDYTISLGQPVLGVLYVDGKEERGLEYTFGDKFTARTTASAPGAKTSANPTLIAPPELYAYFRRVVSPMLIWGAGAGYLFYDRSQGDGGTLLPSVTPAQLLRLRATLELRQMNADKLDFTLSYNGGKVRGLAESEQVANEGGLSLTWMTDLDGGWKTGADLSVAGGVITLSDHVVSPNSAQSSSVDRKITAYQANALVFLRYEFDLRTRAQRR